MNDVCTWRGNGDGTFEAPRCYLTESAGPMALSAADVDHDGRMDLVAVHAIGRVSVLRGVGGGVFDAEEHVRMGNAVGALLATDLDGDRRTDLVTTVFSANAVSVLKGSGDGSFSPVSLVSTGQGPRCVVVADFNRDGRLDLATSNPDSKEVTAMLGLGDLSFEAPRSFAMDRKPWALVAADFNGDANADLVTLNDTSSDISSLLGDGRGGFGVPRQFPVGVQPITLVAADFDGDDRIDIATANGIYFSARSGDVSVVLGNGDGTFQPAVERVPLAAIPQGLVAGDFNTDGIADLAVGNWRNGFLSLLFGIGKGRFRAEKRIPTGASASLLIAADINSDGQLDLASTNWDSSDVSVFLGDGNSSFLSHQRFVGRGHPLSVAAGDFDGNGRLDLAVSHDQDGGFDVFLQPEPADRTPPAIRCPSSLSVDCANKDGAMVDFAVTAADACDPSPTLVCQPPSGGRFPVGTTPVTCTAIDSAGNEATCEFVVTVTCNPAPFGQRPGDANQDGRLNLSDAVWILGHLLLGEHPALPCEGQSASRPGPGERKLLDLDGDGAIDLTDPILLLRHLFVAGGHPPVLGTACVPLSGCPDRCGR